MAIPAVLGLGWLASTIIAGITSLYVFFLNFFVKRVALVSIAIAVIVGLTAAFYLVILGALQGIYVATPAYITQGMQLTLPSNFHSCLTALFTVKTALFVYDWRTKVIQWRLF